MWSDKHSLMKLSDSGLLGHQRLACYASTEWPTCPLWNERQPTFQVQVDPAKMARLHVTLDDVERTTSDALTQALAVSNGS